MSAEDFKTFLAQTQGPEAVARFERHVEQNFAEDNLVPMVVQRTSQGERAMDIFSQLLNNRIIYFGTPVDSNSANLAIAQLLYLESTGTGKPINFYINSPGGSVYDGQGILDTMNYITSPVHTTAVGMAASMGSILLSGGEPGQRRATANTRVMVHQPSGGARGKQTEIGINAKEIEIIRNEMEPRYALWMGLDPYNDDDVDLVHDLMEEDNYLNPVEAKALGLIDEIIYSKTKEADLHPMKAAEHKLAVALHEKSLREAFENVNARDREFPRHKKAIAAIVERRKELTASNDNPGQSGPSSAASGPA